MGAVASAVGAAAGIAFTHRLAAGEQAKPHPGQNGHKQYEFLLHGSFVSLAEDWRVMTQLKQAKVVVRFFGL
jgi:hypothetical protein